MTQHAASRVLGRKLTTCDGTKFPFEAGEIRRD
jgi:hypothetical protein